MGKKIILVLFYVMLIVYAVLKGCQGCFYCRTHEGCDTKDKLSPMYEEIEQANGIVVGFPIYFGNIGGQFKQLIDRMYPMIGADFAPRYPGKKSCNDLFAGKY